MTSAASESGTEIHTHEDSVRERAGRLFRFLRDCEQLRIKTVRDVSAYQSVFWFHELPQEPEVSTRAWKHAGEDMPWLRVSRSEGRRPPEPPELCKGWYDTDALSDYASEPKLFAEKLILPEDPEEEVEEDIEEEGGDDEATGSARPADRWPPEPVRLDDAPEVQQAWEEYLATHWRPWQQEMKRLEPVRRCYAQLFRMHQELQRRGEQYELLVGVGTLLWKDASDRQVRRPVLTVRASLAIDPVSGCIEVSDTDESVDVELEQDMLEHDERPPHSVQEQVERLCRNLRSVWDRDAVIPALRQWFQSLPMAAEGRFTPELSFPAPASSEPQMAFAPVLILRKRSGHAVINALSRIEDALEQGKPLSRTLRRVVGEESDTGNNSYGGGESGSFFGGTAPEEILFPLPANEQQLQIVRRLEHNTGVLVQGPPGTGKSHTIVNLVCHFLAHGKRVLVTSQTPRALKVLQEKFPEEIRPLVVSVLDEKEESRRNLERSVQGILGAVDDPNRIPEALSEQVQSLTARRNEVLSRISELRRRQREIREADIVTHSVPGTHYRGTAQQIALALEREAPRFAWLDDEVGDQAVPLTGAEAGQLVQIWDSFEDGPEAYAAHNVPVGAMVPNEAEFRSRVDEWAAARSRSEEQAAPVLSTAVQWLATAGDNVRRNLSELCRQSLTTCEAVSGRSDWLGQAYSDLSAGRTAVWSNLLTIAQSALEGIQQYSPDQYDCTISTPRTISLAQRLADAEDLLQHLEGGGSLGIWPFRAAVVRRTQHIWQQTRIEGRLCDSPQSLRQLVAALRVTAALERVEGNWPEGGLPSQGSVTVRIASLAEAKTHLERVLEAQQAWENIRSALAGSPLNIPATPDPGWIRTLQKQLHSAEVVQQQADADAAVDELVQTVEQTCQVPNPHECVEELVQAARDRNVERYGKALETRRQVSQRIEQARHCMDLWKRLAAAAPRLAERVRTAPDRQELEAQLAELEPAWAHKVAVAWLARFDEEHSLDTVVRQLKRHERELERLTAQLVACRAWRECVSMLQAAPERQSAMKAWQKTIAALGKGTGKYAETLRREARAYLHECWDAIPAHVMSLSRVAEQFRFDEPEIFDVVIVDEASQTGPEGLLLTYLARQCVIVGDDEQISPETFVKTEAVRALAERYIAGIPFHRRLLPGSSLFDQADIRFRGRITLREHFRCMPEIIRFSNDLCYQSTPLVPLRQYPPDRLAPLVDRFVIDGRREGTSSRVINRPEAAAVVKAVAECLEDPRYEGKSFGVICLQGHTQAELIEQMLLERVGPEPFKDSTIRMLCGDPYSFQGDERDVIFLSMVAAVDSETRITALTHKRYIQRFNVAASRARDQMWLFRSVRESDLSPYCMRRRLIQFMTGDPELLSPDIDVQQLQRVGRTANRSIDRPPEPFESWFEVDVYLALVSGGYRVLPQFPAAGKRIDLVVESPRRRIAVECDGDEWHGPDQYESDCHRQRILERAGWEFIRLRASTFYADRRRAIERLTEQLTVAGVDRWPVTEHTSTIDVVDRGEVRGADCLAWMGRRTIETAEAEVARTGGDDEDVVVDDDIAEGNSVANVDEVGQAVRSPAPPAMIESVSLNRAAPATPANEETAHTPLRQVHSRVTERSDENLSAPQCQPAPAQAEHGGLPEPQPGAELEPDGQLEPEPHPEAEAETETEAAEPVDIAKVIECLERASEPLTAGQIRYRAGIPEEDWPAVEQQLLEQGSVLRTGTGRRPRFALAAACDSDTGETATPNDASDTIEFESVDAETWFRISHWAKKNDHLQPWQRRLAYSLGRRCRDGIVPTEKQEIQGRRILEECLRLGFFNR